MPQGPPQQLPGQARAAFYGTHAETGRAGYHGALLRVARELNNIAHLSHLPAVLGAAAYAESPQQRQDIIRALRAMQVMTGAPLAMETARAGAEVVRHAPDRRMAARELARPAGSEALLQLLPYIQTMASALI